MTRIKHTPKFVASHLANTSHIGTHTHPNVYPLAGDDLRLTYSNGAVQTRVGLELADWGFARGWFPKGWLWRMFPGTKNRNEGTFGCSPVPKTGTRAHSDVGRYQEPERGYIPRVVKTVLLGNGGFEPCRKQGILTKTAK